MSHPSGSCCWDPSVHVTAMSGISFWYGNCPHKSVKSHLPLPPCYCDVGVEVAYLLWRVVRLLQWTPLEPLMSGLGSSQESQRPEAGSRDTPRWWLLALVGPALGSVWDVRNFGIIFIQDEKQNSNFPVIWQFTRSFSNSLNRVDRLDFTSR